MSKLFPKDRWFFDQFNSAARNLHLASSQFAELLQNFSESALLTSTRQIKELEHDGDNLTHQMVDRLNKSFLTPFDREDIYQLIVRMDDVLDMLDGAASRILHYRVGSPPQKLTQLVIVLHHATGVVETLVNSMQPRLSYGKIKPYLEQIHHHENEGDQLQREALMDLFDNEKDPIRVIKLKQIYEFVEAAIDKCEDVANVIEGICVKHA
jgi:predicted phosphate transport protein (TIGR00153 family)